MRTKRDLEPRTVEFLNKLFRKRRSMGLTQEELATKSGLSRGTIQKLEVQSYEPRLGDAFRLADALEFSIFD